MQTLVPAEYVARKMAVRQDLGEHNGHHQMNIRCLYRRLMVPSCSVTPKALNYCFCALSLYRQWTTDEQARTICSKLSGRLDLHPSPTRPRNTPSS